MGIKNRIRPKMETKGKIKFITKNRLSRTAFLLSLILIFSLALGLAKPVFAIDGLMNGKFVTGETDNYLFWLQTYDQNTAPFYTDRLFIDKSGNVSIGTTASTHKLYVNGTGSFTQPVIVGTPTGSTHAATKGYVDSTAGGGVGAGTSGQTLRHNGTSWVANSVLYNNGTNVGIGTTAPAQKLTVVGGAQPYQPTVGLYSTVGAGNGLDRNWAILANYVTYGDFSINQSNADDGNPVSAGTTRFYIKNDGNLGIGASNPRLKTDIRGTLNFPATSGTSQNGALRIGYAGGHGVLDIGQHGGSGGWIQSTNENDLSLNYPLLLNPNGGNVGIGTTNPGVKLDVQSPGYGFPLATGSTQTYGGFRISPPSSSGNVVLDMGTSGGTGAWLQATLRTDLSQVYPILLNINGGNVGIGTTVPTAKLYVNGTGIFTQPVVVGTPTGSTHAATKNYVDSVIAGGSGSTVGYWTQNGTNIYNSNSDNVGIGTTAPTQKLYVDGNIFGNNIYAPSFENFKQIAILTNKTITADTTQVAQSPISPFLWHDIFAFSNPTFETSVDGSAWVGGTTDRRLFSQRESQSITVLNPASYKAVRWTWSSGVQYSVANWIVLAHTYSNPAPNKTILVESSSDGSTWTQLHTSTYNTTSAPVWHYIPSIGIHSYLRITIIWNSGGNINLSGMRLLTSRWGDQGGGSETSYPYAWDENKNITLSGGLSLIGGSISSLGLRFAADLNTGLYNNGSDYLGIVSGGTERMTILSNGSVGIGTTAPLYKLDVAGTGYFSQPVVVGTPTGSTHATTKNYVDSLIAGGSGSTVGYWTQNGTNIYNSNAGNVGIGTTNPGADFHIGSGGLGYIDRTRMILQPPQHTGGPWKIATRDDSSVAYLDFAYGSSKWVTLNSSGNLGIGTTNPGAKLNVNGELRVDNGNSSYYASLQGLYTQNQAFRLGISGHNLITTMDDYYFGGTLQLWTADNPRITINNTGNVGIGTTVPTAKLYVNGTGYFSQPVTVGTPTATTHATTKNYVDSLIAGGSGSTVGYWSMNGTNIYNSNTGNVGIGTTNPAYKLDIQSAAAQMQIKSTTVTNYALFRMNNGGGDLYFGREQSTGGGLATGSTGYAGIINAQGTYPFHFAVNNNIAMTILNGGNVGIGTTNPGAKLDVVGGINVGSYYPIQLSASDVNHGLRYAGSSGTFAGAALDGPVLYGYSGGALGVKQAATESIALRWLSNGNVGIGTTAPVYKLDVAGTGNFTQPVIVATPTASTHAATKGYVDTAAGGGVGAGTSGQTLRHNGTSWVANSAIFNNGTNVGIGTATPVSRLDINGGLSISGNNILSLPSNNPEVGPWNPIWNAIGSGKPLFFDEEFASGSNGVGLYNNSGGTALTITRLTGQTGIPNSTGVVLKISYDGVGATSPGFGGIVQSWTAVANRTYVQRFRAKLPVGKNFVLAENSQGTNNTSYWLTNTAGTGKWEDYIRISHAGNTGTFSNGGYLYVTGGSGAFDWYVSSINVYEVNTPIISSPNSWVGAQTFSGGANFPGSGIWNTSGNVGIGTTAPLYKLDVAGTGNFTQPVVVGTPTASTHAATKNYVDSLIAGGSGSTVGYWTQSGTNIYNSNTGNIGIGITTPLYKLDVAGPARIADSDDSLTIGNNTSLAEIYYDSSVDWQTGTGWASSVRGTDSFYFFQGEERLSIDSDGTTYISGNLGLGTGSPVYKLDVAGTGNFTQPVVVGTPTASTHATTKNYVDSLVGGGVPTGTSGQTLRHNGTSWIANSNIYNNGTNVGIGTTNPGSSLQVGSIVSSVYGLTNGPSNFIGTNIGLSETSMGTVNVTSNSKSGGATIMTGYGPSITFSQNVSQYVDGYEKVIGGIKSYLTPTGNVNPRSSLGFFTHNGSSLLERVTIDYSGNVGIATTTPLYTLEVAGPGTFSQPVRVGTPSAGAHATTKSYVDSAISSLSGSPSFTGDLNMNGNDILNVGKLTVNTIDPLYKIGAGHYSTYAASIAGGVKEEYLGKIEVSRKYGTSYRGVIDFNALEEGSDLWVWRQVVDFSAENVDLILTPVGSFASAYYSVADNRIYVYSDAPATFSYRLSGKRFDWKSWPTRSEDTVGALVVR